jgi:hypothetical protein
MARFEIHPSIKEAIRHNSLILFIGSGYSRNIGLPTWYDLAKTVVDELSPNDPSLEALKTEVPKYRSEPLKIFDALFEKGHNTDSRKILQNIIDVDLSRRDLENQKRIWRISEKVITTNYDKALESAYKADRMEQVEIVVPGDRYKNVSFQRDISYLYKIHGTIDQPETCVLVSSDYEQLYMHNTAFLSALKRLCVNSVILFIGYSIGDKEIQRILENINSLFHIGTKHFVVTPDVTEFEKYGVDTVKIEDYAELPLYLAQLASYRQEIVRQFSAIEESVNAKFTGKQDLLSSFKKENTLYAEKEAFIRQEDRKDIVQLQALNAADPVANESIVNSLKVQGKEEQLKDYLLLRRDASRLYTRAYFEHLETGRDKIYYEDLVKIYLEALKIAPHIFGEINKETVSLYNDIGGGYFYLEDFTNAEYCFQQGLQLALKASESELAAIFSTNLGTVEAAKNSFKSQ